ncbi:NAD(+) diphosphatase [Sphingosinithalassobacter sp. CS137]|uniref:NAD(+) diphosphatase n=1 Tax=Sphingosinithalassobacter sp. CS137 TaxID=2762748 RepID=UPI0021CEB550|nr:NAD(+) diphosphatase [Sphingosinithalassobacter sp. CS137]
MIRPGFTGCTLDRADRLRHDAEALAAATGDWRARLLRLAALDPEIDDAGRLGWGSLADAAENAELVLLGLDERQVPHFAAVDPEEPPVRGRSPALFRMLGLMPPEEASLYAAARSVVDWHMRHRFCAVCGHGTQAFRAGWARKCPNCAAEHFPRTDPVVIMLIEHDDRVLVGRQPGWPPGRYSALAGFLEPGESIEEAVARETLEEAGVRVHGIRYVASQPWPFPSSLMIACIGRAEDDALTVDPNELEDALWVPRAGIRAALSEEPGAPFAAPPPYAIAHTLMRAWLDEA